MALDRVRAVCARLAGVEERLSHGMPSFFVRQSATGTATRALVHLADDHHGDGRLALWCSAPPGGQEALVSSDPERFFVPPYVGPRGWVGMRVDRQPDWDEVAEVVEDAYRSVAPGQRKGAGARRPPSPPRRS